ncbi:MULTISPECIES: heptaprenyl diphosphate synthase component II [Rossellomorea]|jgi:heptaprenyl diphosphate synthase|uniref:Heptaprenyl diphosphate synthase component 2 n=1 Tax=Rossellomorea aquimaris TaxID=189382 RepID=A0A5D4UJ63_9BACI|nr:MULTISPECIES: heptaprenyl diphosphate synthase component II [Rossellomorea]MDT9024664.1 heptaprenyl diphosphate synthase component II [Rossellomorea sp. YC4-1]TYS77408.1 heptaprenyl diphosphate synthase component II [Rossellomorea aquimaris]TYS86590.1 heptaprenyl diphosphate synthase component II [Rossellomorea aquimaris]TYS87372.1 heptaprenyl diphosphate synthase component II [Rossellomorea aquimaris]
MKLNRMYSFLKTDIDEIEKELEVAIESESQLLQEASLHLLQAGGKRIRPVFVLLSAKYGQYDINIVKNVAVALELIHMASLVHDDVIDDAELRRGKPTIKAQWDNRIAMYTGDYIFARALEYMTNIKAPEAHQILSHTIVEVCKGEIAQIKDKYRFDQNLRDYLLRIKRKTALLIAVSCQIGAISSGAPEEIHRRLYRFGYNVGMSFQITDDILDLTASEEELGKPAGSDLWQGNITLPILYAMENPALKTKIERVTEYTSPEEMKDIISSILATDAIDRSHQLSRMYLDRALEDLNHLPYNRVKKTLKNIANYIGKRKY